VGGRVSSTAASFSPSLPPSPMGACKAEKLLRGHHVLEPVDAVGAPDESFVVIPH